MKKSEAESIDARSEGGPTRSSDDGAVVAAERRGRVVPAEAHVNSRCVRKDERVTEAKPFCIPKALLWEAWQRVKANRGAAGIDGQTIG